MSHRRRSGAIQRDPGTELIVWENRTKREPVQATNTFAASASHETAVSPERIRRQRAAL